MSCHAQFWRNKTEQIIICAPGSNYTHMTAIVNNRSNVINYRSYLLQTKLKVITQINSISVRNYSNSGSSNSIGSWLGERTPRNPGCPRGSPQTDLGLSSVDIASVSTWRTQQEYWKNKWHARLKSKNKTFWIRVNILIKQLIKLALQLKWIQTHIYERNLNTEVIKKPWNNWTSELSSDFH